MSLDAIVSEERPNDAIVGTDLGDALNGTASDDDIYGLGGYDIINGAAGTDTAHFESSADYFAVSNVEGITRVEGVIQPVIMQAISPNSTTLNHWNSPMAPSRFRRRM